LRKLHKLYKIILHYLHIFLSLYYIILKHCSRIQFVYFCIFANV